MPNHEGFRNPLYKEIADGIRLKIEDGTYTGNLPSWEQLGLEYGASRITANHAIQILKSEGLLRARQGKGTFVVGAPERREVPPRTLVKPIELQRTTIPPIYAKALSEVRARIESGEFTHRLPTMDELAQAQDVSRITIQKVLRALQREGIVRSYQGLGTFVAGSTEPPSRPQKIIEHKLMIGDLTYPKEVQKPMTYSDLSDGLRFYLWSKMRGYANAWQENPTEENKEKMLAAAGKINLIDKLDEEMGEKLEDVVLVQTLRELFQPEINVICSYPTPGLAAIAAVKGEGIRFSKAQ